MVDDVCTQDDRRVLTGSGDQTIALWDVESQQSPASFCGHRATIKTLATRASNSGSSVFTSGALYS